MKPYYQTESVAIYHGDSREVCSGLSGVTSVVSDPPYELGFMGKGWDSSGVAFQPETWQAIMSSCLPGSMLLAFGGTRTYHRLVCAIEDAGFEIRDCIQWIYGSGFPKSLDVSKAIDKAAGAKREVVGQKAGTHQDIRGNSSNGRGFQSDSARAADRLILDITTPSTEQAKTWDGYGTAAKPAFEPVAIFQKPFDDCPEPRIIVENLSRLESQLCLLLNALRAVTISKSNQSEYDAALNTAQWNAESVTSTLADLSELMDTLRLESAINTTLNTVSSWRSTWGEALKRGSTFTTETATSQIIDLSILKSSALAITPRCIIQAEIKRAGSWLNVLPAARVLNVATKKLSNTLELFAVENAIEKGAMPCPGAVDESVLNLPICVAMKPLEGTFAANALEHGVAGINIDGCRIPVDPAVDDPRLGGKGDWSSSKMAKNVYEGGYAGDRVGSSEKGRWPANIIHDGSDEVVSLFPESDGKGGNTAGSKDTRQSVGGFGYEAAHIERRNDSGSAARFFYCAKASDREIQRAEDFPLWGESHDAVKNTHPTVKPLALMEYLIKLVTMPERNLILDPFMGSGTTLVACQMAGIKAVGIELNEEYCEIAANRLRAS